MWISKDADVRKKELLDAALDLFYEKGCHKTSINDIISRVGVTKGAFYYYFKSMEDVLESIALNEASKLIQVAQKYSSDKNLNALEKMKGLMQEAVVYNKTNAEHRIKLFRLMQDEENAKLAQKIHKKAYEISYPMIKAIIEQGMQEGYFKVESSGDAAELYIQLTSICKNALYRFLSTGAEDPEVNEKAEKKLAYYQQVLQKVLGISVDYGARHDF